MSNVIKHAKLAQQAILNNVYHASQVKTSSQELVYHAQTPTVPIAKTTISSVLNVRLGILQARMEHAELVLLTVLLATLLVLDIVMWVAAHKAILVYVLICADSACLAVLLASPLMSATAYLAQLEPTA